MFNRLCAGIAGACLLTAAYTAPAADFDFKDPKGVNTVVATIDSLVEPFAATADGISGTVSFDPAKPEATTGKLVVDVKSMEVSNAMMTGHMHGEMWLDAEKYPEITYAIKSVKSVEKKGDNRWVLTTVGDFSLHGETKEMTVDIQVVHVKDGVAIRMKGPGDLLVLRAEFTVDRVAYGINPGMNTEKIGKDVTITVAIVGASK